MLVYLWEDELNSISWIPLILGLRVSCDYGVSNLMPQATVQRILVCADTYIQLMNRISYVTILGSLPVQADLFQGHNVYDNTDDVLKQVQTSRTSIWRIDQLHPRDFLSDMSVVNNDSIYTILTIDTKGVVIPQTGKQVNIKTIIA